MVMSSADSALWTRLIQWVLACGHTLGHHPDVAALAITNLCRSAAANKKRIPTDQPSLLLLGITHLWIASKVAGGRKSAMTLEEVMSILERDGSAVTEEVVKKAERVELDQLRWRVCGVLTPQEFIDEIVALHYQHLWGTTTVALAHGLANILTTCVTTITTPRRDIAVMSLVMAIRMTGAELCETNLVFPSDAWMANLHMQRLEQLVAHWKIRVDAPEAALWVSHLPSPVVDLLRKYKEQDELKKKLISAAASVPTSDRNRSSTRRFSQPQGLALETVRGSTALFSWGKNGVSAIGRNSPINDKTGFASRSGQGWFGIFFLVDDFCKSSTGPPKKRLTTFYPFGESSKISPKK